VTPFSEFSHGKVTANGTLIHFRKGGSGEPVILIHGWPQHSLQWHAVAPALAETYSVIAPDLPGCSGSSIPPGGGYDKKSVARMVKALLDELGVGQLRVVGFDHGAGVAYNFACQHPD
jgi:pimeloyl-ACP methyl ester carboxylesterase